MRLLNCIRVYSQPHYLVIGHYTGLVIGCCRGGSGKRDVLAEEPLAMFKRCNSRKCPICREIEVASND